MAKYNGPTPKRHKLWSNDEPLVTAIIQDAASMTKQEMAQCRGAPLVRKYTDRHGAARVQGIKKNLKNSQTHGTHLLLSHLVCLGLEQTHFSSHLSIESEGLHCGIW